MKNKEVAEALYRISELLTMKNENVFKVRAYERASGIVASHPEPVEDLSAKGSLTAVPGIGEGIAEKIREFLAYGKISYLEELKSSFPDGFFEIMNLQGVGPKKAKALFDKLKIDGLGSLKKAAQTGKISSLPGFGKKSEENILKSIALKEKYSGRILLAEALSLSRELLRAMKSQSFVLRADAAGSVRRARETIGDIDILCAVEKGKESAAVEFFAKLPSAGRVTAAGPTKASLITGSGIQVDLRVVDPLEYGAALQYFTGSKEHNIKLRGLANDLGLTVNEYGVFKAGGSKRPVASKTEEDVYRALGLAFIPPELRENRGELEAAQAGKLPKLIELKDIKGDFHVHSEYSDGSDSLETLAEKAMEAGYEWLAVTDHSQSLKVARGLGTPELRRKMRQIEKLNSKFRGFRLLCGAEADILNDGSIDYPDELLKELDFVIASIHTGFTQSGEQITGRVLKALQHPYVHCIGHLTGRLLNEREPYAIDPDRVLEAARQNGKFLELNAYPNRLDLNDIHCRKAKEAGLRICIGTDSHAALQFGNMDIGVRAARRGWLEDKDVLNTLTLKELSRALKRDL